MPAASGMICGVQTWFHGLMKHHLISLMQNLTVADSAPEWIHLLPAGTFTGVDGRGPYVAGDLQEIITNSIKPGRKLPLDINHSTDKLGTKGHEAPAVGWIIDMEARESGVWGKVEWTEKGRAAVTGREYGYLSPAIMATEKPPHRIAQIARASLTNDPNLTLTSLHTAHFETGDPEMEEELRLALGLPKDADTAAILAAVTANATDNSTHSATLTRIIEAAGLAKDAGVDAIITTLQSRKAGGDTDKVTELENTVVSLQNARSTLTNDTAKKTAETTIDAAIEGGKIVPALRDRYITRHMKDPADVEAEIKLLPSIHSSTLRNYRPSENGDASLSHEDQKIVELMGLDSAAFAATSKAMKKEAL